MRNHSYAELSRLYSLCHGPGTGEWSRHMSVMEWAKRMEAMLGPDTCRGFFIRSHESGLRGMWLSENSSFVSSANDAHLYTWGQAATKCTVNRKLEAVRIEWGGISRDSKGNIIIVN